MEGIVNAVPVELNCGDQCGEVLQKLLKKIRRVGFFLRYCDGEKDPLNYMTLARLLSDSSESTVYVLGRKGEILGCAYQSECGLTEIDVAIYGGDWGKIDDASVFVVPDGKDRGKCLMCVPIFGVARNRLGAMVSVRFDRVFGMTDIFLAEYLGMLAGIGMLNEWNRNIGEELRDKNAVQAAMRVLSPCEVKSIKHVVAGLDDCAYEGVVVVRKLAYRIDVTHSVIVSALRKLESAGLIESRNMGKKGTYIKVLSPLFIKELGGAEL